MPTLLSDWMPEMQYVSQNARFSRCRRYRYSLERVWMHGSGSVLFIGLNPSTADHRRDDPTIRRCVRYARDWGYQRMEIVNLFAFRATLPGDLKRADQPIGRQNDRWIAHAHRQTDLTVACWGNDGIFMDRDQSVRAELTTIHCIKVNQSGQPAHPLYSPANLRPIPLPDIEVSV